MNFKLMALCLAGLFLGAAGGSYSLGADPADEEISSVLSRMQEQINQLQRQVADQQRLIEQLQRPDQEPPAVAGPVPSAAPPAPVDRISSEARSSPISFGENILLSGEGGVAFLDTGPHGLYPDSEFRVDEARLFLDVQLSDAYYVFSELNLAVRENIDNNVKLGELYLEIEDLSRWWGEEGQATLRLGRLDIPFGEEYLVRDAFDNPLISHSLADFWGIDEGAELFGRLGPIDYVVAVQNGGVPTMNDYDSDKAVITRIGVEPAGGVRLSLSAMRTGDLAVEGDEMSELWFGNGFVRALGAPETTSTFHADLLQGDVKFKWNQGHLLLSAGLMDYDDNDTAGNNQRDVYFCTVEALQRCTDKLYGSARFSRILADDGFPIVGLGDYMEYFYEDLTEDIWRLSLGIGYQLDPRLVLKTEYAYEQREAPGAGGSEDDNLVAAEAAFKF